MRICVGDSEAICWKKLNRETPEIIWYLPGGKGYNSKAAICFLCFFVSACLLFIWFFIVFLFIVFKFISRYFYHLLLKINLAMDNSLTLIRDQQKQSWNKFSNGWKNWDNIVMDFLSPMGKEIIRLIHPAGDDRVLDIAPAPVSLALLSQVCSAVEKL